jgi:hypothetical protein
MRRPRPRRNSLSLLAVIPTNGLEFLKKTAQRSAGFASL